MLLLALAIDPNGENENIIVGVYPLARARESTDKADRKGGYWTGGGVGEGKWVDGQGGP